MDKLYIQGGTKLQGEIYISGAKNAALPILFASLLAEEPLYIKNVPCIRDVETTIKLLTHLGVKNKRLNHIVFLDPRNITTYSAPTRLVKNMRASIWILGILLARFGRAKVALPGGCPIGNRPVDLHLSGLQELGATISLEEGYINAVVNGRLKGSHISMDKKSVGATLTLMCAATLAVGNTTITNAASEPEIVDTANFLNCLGAKIIGVGGDNISITGVTRLRGGCYNIIPDRIETGTFLVGAAISRGHILCHNTKPNLLKIVLKKLRESGADIITGNNWIEINMHNKRPHAVNIHTSPYPGFPTDLQALFTLLNIIAKGTGIIKENIFENRFLHVPELIRMGACIKVENNTLISNGVNKLYGTRVKAYDLRASACLILAGCIAEGTTVIENFNHIDRGYENIQKKLEILGAKIKTLPTNLE
ncbi:MAG: UDP-N-acetylglucosamine 1-carboxyvinyltransferase [Candidatus Dasytiphilus stammeri]